jgi:hypothetical protein
MRLVKVHAYLAEISRFRPNVTAGYIFAGVPECAGNQSPLTHTQPGI